MKIHLLVVEDDPAVARALKRALSAEGWSVDIATSGNAARETAGVYDCAVMDLELPDTDGVSLARSLVRAGRVGRIVFFSATSDPELIAAANREGECVHKSEGVVPLVAVVSDLVRSIPGSRPCAVGLNELDDDDVGESG